MTMLDQARKDASVFLAALPPDIPAPHVSEGEDEVVVEWLIKGRRAFVSFDGDGQYGYAMQVGDRNCIPGSEDGRVGQPVPADLIAHLRSAA